MAPPAFDHDLGFSERVEDFSVEQFVAQALVLPNYTTIPGPILSVFHSAFFGVLILLLYGVFLTVQTVRHPYYFKQPVVKRARKVREAAAPLPHPAFCAPASPPAA